MVRTYGELYRQVRHALEEEEGENAAFAARELLHYVTGRDQATLMAMQGLFAPEEVAERYLDAVGDYVQIVQNNDDFGSQLNMLLSPELYRKFFKPRHARINEAIRRKKKDIHISLHCCGSIYPIIGDIIESGYDILNPIQKEAANMDPYAIKKNFGDHVTIWGGACSTQTTLTHGSIDEIVAECKEMMKCYAPGGGFVYAAIHNIQADISPEKIMAVFETGRNCGVPSFYRSSSL